MNYGYSGREFPIDENWSLATNLKFNIFDGFSREYKIKEAKADFEFAVKNTDIPEQLYYICKSATTGNDIYKYNLNTKQFELYSQLVNDFRKQIIAKSVLAGVTPLYNQDVVFNYTIDQQVVSQPDHVDRVSTDLVISPFGFENVENKTPKKLGTETSATYKLKDNESLQFLAPSFITKRNYSNYVAYQFIKKNPTETNQYLGISYSSYETRQDKDTLKLYAFTETFEIPAPVESVINPDTLCV